MCESVLVVDNYGNQFECVTVGALAIALGVTNTDVSDDAAQACLCNAKLDQLGAEPNEQIYPLLLINLNDRMIGGVPK